DATDGTLFLGASAVSAGQVISAQNLSRMTYAAAGTATGVGAFTFAVDGGAYSVECRVYAVDALGEAPTNEYAPVSALSAFTHRSLSCEGRLSGYDPDGDALVYEIVTPPAHGAVRILDRAAGTYLYTPYNGYTGDDAFSYVVRDAQGNYSRSREVTLTVSEPTVEISFSDLIEDHDVNTAITMAEHHIMNGTQVGSKTFFYPEKTVSREDFLAMAMRTVGITEADSDAHTVFADDAKISAPLRGYVAKAYDMGIVHGTFGKDGLYFQPDRAITRAEAAKILSGLIGASDVMTSEIKAPAAQTVATVTFDDETTIPAWAEEAVYHLSAIGIFPTEDGKADVTAALTRAEAAEMFASLLAVMG
ncbi:MAG: S-layer homology domain-containing protein, partial [Clostridia bacterium]|nr:S-layer homology domain-containing protein [Clostridia bacterium]